MNVLGLVLHGAFAAAVLAVAAGALHIRGHGRARHWAYVAMAAATALSVVAFLALVVLFILVDTSYQYVFLYTSTDIPLRYRVAGAWAGREGSMLLWATFTGLAAVCFSWWQRRVDRSRDKQGPAPHQANEPHGAGTGAGAGTAARTAAGPRAAPQEGGPAGGTGLAGGTESAAGGSKPATGATGPAAGGAGQAAGVTGPAAGGAGQAAGAAGPAGSPGADRSVAWTELVLAAVAAAFMGAVAFQGTFAATDDFLLRNRPGGNGLNPTLLNPFILIHPPLMFAAYALTAVPLAAAVAEQVTGRGAWSRTGMLWSRIDWLLYTAAMGLGGIWAYYTLGFGGYWAWDPVEVANLLPWLALTLFLHAQLHHRRYGRYRHLGPLLGVLPFLLTLFSTISTRSGLWVSVHAFTDPTGTFDPDAPNRMLEILARDSVLQFHAGLFLVVLAAFLALWAHRVSIDTGLLPRAHRVVAGVLGAVAVAAALAPQATLGLLLEAAVRIVPDRPGFGLLALTAAAVLAPAAPLLMGKDEGQRLRLDMKGLALVSIAVLGTGLLVLFLWHMAAVNGWSSSVYRGRFPVIAAPAALGLLVFQAHAIWRQQALWVAAAAAAASGLAAVEWGIPGFLLVLTGALVGVSLYRVVHAAAKASRAVVAARGALWIAALLNVLFWLNPPTIRLGVSWQPQWPTQLVMGLLALLGLHLATRLLAGHTRRSGTAHLVVGVLGGYYVAPLAAAASWRVHRRGGQERARASRRTLHHVGLYGIHLAVAVALLGYTTSTYLATQEDHELAPGQQVQVGGVDATLLGIDQQGRPRVERIVPELLADGTSAAPVFYWEAQTASHYPLPATARLWDRDVYFAIDAVCIDASGACDSADDWVRAYDTTARLPAGVDITQVRLQVFDLPGIALVWGALALWLYCMALLMAHGPERP